MDFIPWNNVAPEATKILLYLYLLALNGFFWEPLTHTWVSTFSINAHA